MGSSHSPVLPLGNPCSPWTTTQVSALPRDARGQLVRDGRDLMLATYAHIGGPNVDDAAKRYAGNNVACTNCHLSKNS